MSNDLIALFCLLAGVIGTYWVVKDYEKKGKLELSWANINIIVGSICGFMAAIYYYLYK